MFRSRFTDLEKREILNERMVNGSSVRAVCEKHGITVPTFYTWQRKLTDSSETDLESIPDIQGETPEAENRILRRLYVDLSAHNYELAKFLEK